MKWIDLTRVAPARAVEIAKSLRPGAPVLVKGIVHVKGGDGQVHEFRGDDVILTTMQGVRKSVHPSGEGFRYSVLLKSDEGGEESEEEAEPESAEEADPAAAEAEEEANKKDDGDNEPAPAPALAKGGAKPSGGGWEPIPGGAHGGMRQKHGAGYNYWYPDDNARLGAANHHNRLALEHQGKAREALAAGKRKEAGKHDEAAGDHGHAADAAYANRREPGISGHAVKIGGRKPAQRKDPVEQPEHKRKEGHTWSGKRVPMTPARDEEHFKQMTAGWTPADHRDAVEHHKEFREGGGYKMGLGFNAKMHEKHRGVAKGFVAPDGAVYVDNGPTLAKSAGDMIDWTT